MNREKRIRECAKFLEDYDEMFCDFVDLCSINIDPSQKTACVQFDPKKGRAMALAFNPNYIDAMDDYSLSFLIAHEICHVYFMHGIRGQGLKDHKKANICMDIAINHYLVDQLRFDRTRVFEWDSLCWVDTVLKTPVVPKYNFEYYYNLDNSLFNSGYRLLDEHNFFNPKNTPAKVADVLATNSMPGIGDENGAGEEWVDIVKKRQAKFEQIIKNKIGQICGKKPRVLDSWAKIDRRLCFFGDDLPVMDRQLDIEKPEKFKLVFFVDVSGSCLSFLERFANFAASIPEDKFETDFYLFDTKIVKIDLQGDDARSKIRLAGIGGGTSFKPLVRQVEEMEREPDLVFVLTDGFASPIKVKNTKPWHWFLTKGGSRSSIKGQGKILKMSQYG